MLAPMAVDAVMKIVDPAQEQNVDLKDIRIIKKLGETVEDSQLVDGIVFTQKPQGSGGPNKVERGKIGLIQFCISPPKTDVSWPGLEILVLILSKMHIKILASILFCGLILHIIMFTIIWVKF